MTLQTRFRHLKATEGKVLRYAHIRTLCPPGGLDHEDAWHFRCDLLINCPNTILLCKQAGRPWTDRNREFLDFLLIGPHEEVSKVVQALRKHRCWIYVWFEWVKTGLAFHAEDFKREELPAAAKAIAMPDLGMFYLVEEPEHANRDTSSPRVSSCDSAST